MERRLSNHLVCVDSRAESHAALKLACLRAKVRGSGVQMLHVIPPNDAQSLFGVADRMRAEQHDEAQLLMQELAAQAYRESGVLPAIQIREGQVGEEIIATVLENPDISMVVLGIAQQSAGRGKLASWLSSQLGGKLLIPLLMVPGNLTDQQLAALI